jgi:PmbA protein
MSESQFSYTLEQIQEMSEQAINLAKQQGASDVEAEVVLSVGKTVSVRLADVETIEYNRDKGLSVTVYFGHQKGHASSADLSPQAIKDTVLAACNIARYTAQDPYCGLPEASLLADRIEDLDLYHPWDISVDEAIDMAKSCERFAREIDSRIVNSEGASVSSHTGIFAYANSLGFNQGYASSRHSLSCSVIAEDAESMQRDYWYSTARSAQDLESAQAIGQLAGQRTVRRLGSRKMKTASVPVIFEAPIASTLISHLLSAISGGNLYRKSSFLLDSLDQLVMAPHLTIYEDPHIPRGLASSAFDNEGVKTTPRTLVENGILKGYMLSSYSARKLGMQTTGNAGGSHNLLVSHGDKDLPALMKMMGTGLLVTELLGHGINMVTGDYSRGAAGFWVENGVIAYPVEEITIAGNLKDMFMQIVEIGSDVILQSSRQVGSILIEKMTVAGA